jgi:hypothetical protein
MGDELEFIDSMKLQASHHDRDGRHQAPLALKTWSYRLNKADSYDSNLGNTELDADQCLDAVFQAFSPIARGRRSGVRRSGAVEVGDLATLRSVVGGAHEGVDGNRLDDLDLLAIQIDGIHIDENMLLVATIGVDANGDKHPIGLVEGATENETTVQALIDNQSWLRESEQSVEWIFCLTAARVLVANQEQR